MSLRSKILGLGVILIVGAWVTHPPEKYFEIAKSLDIFSTLFKEVNTYYVDEIDPKKLIDTGIEEMLSTLDPYTDYIPEEDGESFTIQTTGQYAGIGALIGVVHKKTVVRQTYIGYPAHSAGIKVGDELLSVDGKNVKNNSSTDASTLLKGIPKTEVEIKIKRPGLDKELTFKIKREKIKLSNVVCEELIGNTGYIKLDDFTPGAAKEVAQALNRLKKSGAKGLILDLRENLGGLMFEAVDLVNLFIPKGQEVVSTKGKAEDWNKTYRTLSQPADLSIPLVVLVGNSSASASEIVAGALQDYDRAVLVGEKTFGKGLVQTTRQLPYNAQLKVTTAKYYIPSGRCIQALDYTNRKSDGSVGRVADSLKAEFKTKNGRKVYDGGGLDPDIKLEQADDIPLLAGLFFDDYFFEYANLYCSKNPKPTELQSFKISDKDYVEFTQWLKASQFTYTTQMETEVEKMIKEAESGQLNSEVITALKTLKQKILDAKQTDVIRHRESIAKALAEEIGFHYALHKGRFDVSFKNDKELQVGIQVLSDQAHFKKILLATNGSDSKP